MYLDSLLTSIRAAIPTLKLWRLVFNTPEYD